MTKCSKKTVRTTSGPPSQTGEDVAISIPPTAGYGSTVSIQFSRALDIVAVYLEKLGTSTAQANQVEDSVPLNISGRGFHSVQVRMPPGPEQAQPGDYRLRLGLAADEPLHTPVLTLSA